MNQLLNLWRLCLLLGCALPGLAGAQTPQRWVLLSPQTIEASHYAGQLLNQNHHPFFITDPSPANGWAFFKEKVAGAQITLTFDKETRLRYVRLSAKQGTALLPGQQKGYARIKTLSIRKGQRVLAQWALKNNTQEQQLVLDLGNTMYPGPLTLEVKELYPSTGVNMAMLAHLGLEAGIQQGILVDAGKMRAMKDRWQYWTRSRQSMASMVKGQTPMNRQKAVAQLGYSLPVKGAEYNDQTNLPYALNNDIKVFGRLTDGNINPAQLNFMADMWRKVATDSLRFYKAQPLSFVNQPNLTLPAKVTDSLQQYLKQFWHLNSNMLEPAGRPRGMANAMRTAPMPKLRVIAGEPDGHIHIAAFSEGPGQEGLNGRHVFLAYNGLGALKYVMVVRGLGTGRAELHFMEMRYERGYWPGELRYWKWIDNKAARSMFIDIYRISL